MHQTSPDVTEPTCVAVLRRGYRSASGCSGPRWSRSPSRSRRPAQRAAATERRRAERSGDGDPALTRRPTSGEEGRPVSTKDFAREGLLRGPRRPQGRLRRRDQEGVPEARPRAATRTTTRATPRPRSGSRRSPRRTTCCPTSQAAQGVRRGARRCSAPARSARGARRRRRPAGASTCGDLFGGDGRPGRPAAGGGAASATCSARIFGGGARRAARRPGRAAARDVEAEVTLDFADAVRRRDGAAAADQRRAPATPATAPAPSRAPRRGPARPATAPGRSPATRARSRFSEPCRDCQGAGTVVDDPCPECRGTGR